jgi:ATP-dependent helicase HrpB
VTTGAEPPPPALGAIGPLREALDGRGVAVLVAPPGTGKTTAVPLALLDAPWAGGGRILLTEPRRLAVRAAARRMASVRGDDIGQSVGYAVRGESRRSPRTLIEVVTEGLALRRLQADPSLPGVGAVLVDEVHERSLDVDLLLAFLVEVRASLREDLRVLVMSATVEPGPLAGLLGGGDGPAPVIEVGAATHSVRTVYRPGSARDAVEDRVADVVAEALATDPGDILAFLPGRAEIRRTAAALARRPLAGDPIVLQLHGSVPADEQDDVLAPARDGRRRVVLATSIAETSLTVPGVRVVIDSGRRRTVRVDPSTSLPALVTVPVGRSGADQRRGRAGRTAPGVAYRLWSANDERHRPPDDLPAVLREDLSGLVLQAAEWGSDPRDLPWWDPLPGHAVDRARGFLVDLGAVDGDGRITARGRRLARLGGHPRVAATALAGLDAGVPRLGAAVAAVLESGSPGPDVTETVAEALAGRGDDATRQALRVWTRALDRIGADETDGPTEPPHTDPLDTALVAALVLAGSPDRVARRRSGTRSDDRGRTWAVHQLRGGGEVATSAEGPLGRCEWLVVLDLDAGARVAGAAGRLHAAVPVDGSVVLDRLASSVGWEGEVRWDRRARDVIARRRRRLGAIVLEEVPWTDPPADEVAAAAAEGLTESGLAALGRLGEADELRARVACLRNAGDGLPGAPWPDWSDETLLATASTWLPPHISTVPSRRGPGGVDVVSALRSTLRWDQAAALDQLAPTHWTLPSGRRVRLRYGALDGDAASVVAIARLQDLLGVDDHPTVAAGRVRVTVELRSPANRPVQRTTDLPGFWRGSYAAVRSELRGRYPRHAWPERPWE